MIITYSGCEFVALVIQDAMRMRHILSLACPALQYFFHILINCSILEKKLLNIKCILIFFSNSAWNIFYSVKDSATFDQKCILVLCKLPVMLFGFCEIWIFLTYFRKIFNCKFSWKSLQWEPLFHADGRTDNHDEFNSRFFFKFLNSSKNDYFLRFYHSYLRISFRCFHYLSFEIGYTWTYKIYIRYAVRFEYVGDIRICLHLGTFHTTLPLDIFYAHWICIPLIINRKSI